MTNTEKHHILRRGTRQLGCRTIQRHRFRDNSTTDFERTRRHLLRPIDPFYQSPLISTELFHHNLINFSYLSACYLYQVMMTLHFVAPGSASLAMSTNILKALPGKLDIKRHSPGILYFHLYDALSTGQSS